MTDSAGGDGAAEHLPRHHLQQGAVASVLNNSPPGGTEDQSSGSPRQASVQRPAQAYASVAERCAWECMRQAGTFIIHAKTHFPYIRRSMRDKQNVLIS